MSILSIAGYFLTGVGGLVLFTSGLGVLRMPDVLNRMHAGTKSTTLGTILFLSGIGCFEPAWLPKLMLIVVFIILTNPVSSHALARAVHMNSEEKPDNLVEDDLPGVDEPGGDEE